MDVFDAHAHAFPDALAAPAVTRLVAEARWRAIENHHDGTLKGLLHSMDRAGVRRAIMCSVATRPQQVPKITDWSAQVASERIIPFGSVHPGYETPEAEIERMAALGIRGIKLHPQYMQCALDDERIVRIARAAAANDLAITVHSGYDLAYEKDDLGSPRRLRNLHDAVPGLRLLACHLGGWECWEESLELLVGRPIYLETSFCLGQCAAPVLEAIVTRHPRQYLMFGTDAPWADQAEMLAQFMALPLDDDARRLALWENAHAYLKLPLSHA